MSRLVLRRCLGTALAGALLLLTGCGAGQTGTPGTAPIPSSTLPTLPAPVPLNEFCGSTTPHGLVPRTFSVSDRVSLNSAWLGSGSTVAVLLHQTDGNGLCGFLFYADYLARRGLRVALLDLCDYGQSVCLDPSLAADPTAQVQAVVDAARSDGARRIVLVGASMGGSIALTAARSVQADAVVDLSGPAVFQYSDITDDASNITMPALFAFARTDPDDLAAVHAALPDMPTRHKAFLTFNAGHGYELLQDHSSGTYTPLAPRVAHFVATGHTS